MKAKGTEALIYEAVKAGELEILPDGTVWRITKKGWDRWQQRTVSRPCKRVRAENSTGKREYFQVRVMWDKVRYYCQAHRLVWLHFHGPIPEGMTINHKNGIKTDNRPDNLELATHSEQQIHAARTLRVGHACNQSDEKNSMSKLTNAQVIEIRKRRATGEMLKSIARDFNVTYQTISKIARKDRRS